MEDKTFRVQYDAYTRTFKPIDELPKYIKDRQYYRVVDWRELYSTIQQAVDKNPELADVVNELMNKVKGNGGL